MHKVVHPRAQKIEGGGGGGGEWGINIAGSGSEVEKRVPMLLHELEL